MTNQVKGREVLNPSNLDKKTNIRVYKKILVAVDEGTINQEVFGTALQLAKTYQSQLMICTVIQENISQNLDLPIYSEMTGYGAIYTQEMVDLEEKLIQERLEELQNWLKQLTEQSIHQGIKTESNYTYGEPGKEICAKAEKWEADLIIIGRRGRNGLSELLLGSVSNYVVHHAPCSILVVQH
jgi:nucleotide-binding universal stress UspA family protein